MFDLRYIFPWTHKKAPFVNPDLDPVLLVPGIGGSILCAVNEKGRRERVWVRLFAADNEFKSKLWSLYDPETGKTLSLDPKTKIEVPTDRHGLYASDILDPDVVLPMSIVCYFHDLIQKMIDWGYEEGSTLFGFGYDFRQSNRLPEVMDGFKSKLETIYKASGGKKLNIVSHSMGGVLVKSFLALHHDVFEKFVNTWIAIAAPFQGAPGFIMDVLLTGVEFVKGWERELFVAKWSMHQLLIECPSVYELMGNAEFKWPETPLLKIWQKEVDSLGKVSVELKTYNPEESIAVVKSALVNNTVNYKGKTIPLPFNDKIFKWALETQKTLKSAKLPGGVKFYNIFCNSYDTPFSVCYGSEESPIESLQDILHTEADYNCTDGDGTVPLASAMADELSATARVGIPGEHRGVLHEDRLFRILKHWLNAGDPDPFYNPIIDYVLLPTKAECEKYEKHFHHITAQWESLSEDSEDYCKSA
eukprot:c16952_g1_i1 orf=246-1667(+)